MQEGGDTYTLRAVAATTGALTGRAFRLGLHHLEDARDRLLSGRMNLGLDHDSTKTLAARVRSAEIVDGEAGEKLLLVEWELSADEVARFGDRTGISLQTVDWEIEGWVNPEESTFALAADCYHWTEAEIVDALREAQAIEPSVAGGLLIQLADEPPIKIIINFLENPETIGAMWAAVFAGVGALLARLRPKREGKPETKVVIDVRRDGYFSVVESDSAESAEKICGLIADAVKALGPPGTGAGPAAIPVFPEGTGEIADGWAQPS